VRENEEDVGELRKKCLCKAPSVLLQQCSYFPCPLDLPVPSLPPWQPGGVAAPIALKLFVHAMLPLQPLPWRHLQVIAYRVVALCPEPPVTSPGVPPTQLLTILSNGQPPCAWLLVQRAPLPFQLPSFSSRFAYYYAVAFLLVLPFLLPT
jgi:hypothetical protein